MEFTTAQVAAWVGSILWPFFRIAGMLMVIPLFSALAVPPQIRILLALVLALMLGPQIGQVPAVEPLSATAFLVTLQQVLIGAVMGFVVSMTFAALSIAGEGIAMSMGLGFAQMTDPQTGFSVPVISNYFNVVVALLFLALNGHLALISLTMDSFRLMPIADSGVSSGGIYAVLAWAGQMYAGAVLVALPAFAALLMVNLGFGVVTRAAPQLNIFAVGFPAMILLGFSALIVMMPTIAQRFTELLHQAYGLLGQILVARG